EPPIIETNRNGYIALPRYVKCCDGSVGGAPETVRHSVLTVVRPHDSTHQINATCVGPFEGTVRRRVGGGARGRPHESCDRARGGAHEAVIHAVHVSVEPGDFAAVIDTLGKGTLPGVAVGPSARDVNRRVLAVWHSHESMNRTTREIRAADPVVACDC